MLFISACVSAVFLFSVCEGRNIFHEDSKVTFYPDSFSEYFGYSVVLKNDTLLVGAPKALSRVHPIQPTGLVFDCPLKRNVDGNITCYPYSIPDTEGSTGRFFRGDMWFGATMAVLPREKLLVCAPRWTEDYKAKHYLAFGACCVVNKNKKVILTPLSDVSRLAFRSDGSRKEYQDKVVNFFAYGQSGMSLKATESNSIILGAPGLLQWTGGIVDYTYNPNSDDLAFKKKPVHSGYYTKDLEPDEYFGYSVESGIFDKKGTVFYVAGAPRGKLGYGQVLVFDPKIEQSEPLNIKSKIGGPQLGAYFGASLCCVDIDGDGLTDILIGAPNFYDKKDGGLPYDQGAVFVVMTQALNSGFVLKSAGSVKGSRESGARFGTVIADLGDVDGDGFRDIAIGAPWENDGMGAVYIYKGKEDGLSKNYVQRIIAEGSRSFGMSIAKGVDVDNNQCNDLAIGAHTSGTAYLYRCVQTITVKAAIRVPNAMNLPQNATNFTALFCVNVPLMKSWPHVIIDLKASIRVDAEKNRAMISGDSEYWVTAKSGNDFCSEQVVEVKPTADLSEPISLEFQLEPKDEASLFVDTDARLSEESNLKDSFLIQLVRDCGDDLICNPWLVMSLDTISSSYTPGTDEKFGVILSILNKEEPAYGAKVHLYLPLPPKRVPSDCLLEGQNMTCNVPAPLKRGESVEWEIELEYVLKVAEEKKMTVDAKLEDAYYQRQISDDPFKTVYFDIKPKCNFSITGKSLPNATLSVSRDQFYEANNFTFKHYFEITNFGPSWANIFFKVEIPENVSFAQSIKGCTNNEFEVKCNWFVPAKESVQITVPLNYDLRKYGKFLNELVTYNATSILNILSRGHRKLAATSTVLILDPAEPLWPVLVGAIGGLLVLAAMIYGLDKCGFFSRRRRDDLNRLIVEQKTTSELDGSTSAAAPINSDAEESTAELISEDSDSS